MRLRCNLFVKRKTFFSLYITIKDTVKFITFSSKAIEISIDLWYNSMDCKQLQRKEVDVNGNRYY